MSPQTTPIRQVPLLGGLLALALLLTAPQTVHAAAYQTALESVMALDADLPIVAKRRIQQALTDAKSEQDAGRRAWLLRPAIDDTLRGGVRN